MDALLANPFVSKSVCGKMICAVLTSPDRDPLLHHLPARSRNFLSLHGTHAAGSTSSLFLNGPAPDARDLVVHDHCTRFTTVQLSPELLPSVQEQTTAWLNYGKSFLGKKYSSESQHSSSKTAAFSKGIDELTCEEAKVVNVTVVGILFLGVVVGSFVGYVQKSL